MRAEPEHRLRTARFDELDPATLYELLRLRVDVFVVEQRCAYPELDGRDPVAQHCWVEADGTVVAYLRVLREAGALRVGRVVTRPEHRGRGLAGVLLRAVLEQAAGPVVLDAQSQLQGWYEAFGFTVTGPEFLEDGIPHVPMRLEAGGAPR